MSFFSIGTKTGDLKWP